MFNWIAGHKKISATIIGAIAQVIGSIFPDYSAMINQITQLIMAYIVGQGVADLGKSAAQIELNK